MIEVQNQKKSLNNKNHQVDEKMRKNRQVRVDETKRTIRKDIETETEMRRRNLHRHGIDRNLLKKRRQLMVTNKIVIIVDETKKADHITGVVNVTRRKKSIGHRKIEMKRDIIEKIETKTTRMKKCQSKMMNL